MCNAVQFVRYTHALVLIFLYVKIRVRVRPACKEFCYFAKK